MAHSRGCLILGACESHEFFFFFGGYLPLRKIHGSDTFLGRFVFKGPRVDTWKFDFSSLERIKVALILDESPCQDLCTIHHAISNLYERVRRSGDTTLEDFWNNLVLGRERWIWRYETLLYHHIMMRMCMITMIIRGILDMTDIT